MHIIKVLNLQNIEEIKGFFKSVFSAPPWNDDWSNEQQLHNYINDLIGNVSSLTFGLYDDNELIGISLGNIRHWFTGTEYFIDEFCISTRLQGKGFGTYFLKRIEECIVQKGIRQMFLQTQRNLPAYKFYEKNGFVELKDHVSLVKDLWDN